MIRLAIRTLAISLCLLGGNAQATSLVVSSFSEDGHSVWIPGLDQRHLHFDEAATLVITPEDWQLTGMLTSATDGSRWSISVSFSDVLTGPEFSTLSGLDDDRIKGASWSQMTKDWAFAQTVTGKLAAIDGEYAGHSFSLTRMPGSHDYWAQLGTCLNDKDCEVGLSSWITITDDRTQQTYHGDINLRVSAPVPEPSAALVFGLGTLVVGGSIRRRAARTAGRSAAA